MKLGSEEALARRSKDCSSYWILSPTFHRAPRLGDAKRRKLGTHAVFSREDFPPSDRDREGGSSTTRGESRPCPIRVYVTCARDSRRARLDRRPSKEKLKLIMTRSSGMVFANSALAYELRESKESSPSLQSRIDHDP